MRQKLRKKITDTVKPSDTHREVRQLHHLAQQHVPVLGGGVR